MDRINKIKIEIMYVKDSIEIYENIITKFKQLPKGIQDGINKGMYKGDFISNNQKHLEIYRYQLENLNRSLKELL